MVPDFLSEIFKAAGLDMPVRNFLVDYRDGTGEFYHKPLQVICIRDYSDSEIINNIMQDVEMQNMTIDGITEIRGEHSLAELSAMSQDVKAAFEAGFRYLYLRDKKSH